jgi:hypothetical protein
MPLIENKAFKLLTKTINEHPSYKMVIMEAFVEFLDNLEDGIQEEVYNTFANVCNNINNVPGHTEDKTV